MPLSYRHDPELDRSQRRQLALLARLRPLEERLFSGWLRRLREHDLVVLSLPDDRLLTSSASRFYVVAMFGSVAGLHPADAQALELLPERVPRAYISFRHQGHLVALQGTLHGGDGRVSFKVSDGVSLPRRSSTRVEFVAPLTLRRRDGSSADGVTHDIALDGALIEHIPPLEVGDEILLSIAIPTREVPVETAARVVRTHEQQAGVAFTSIDQDARRFLGGLIYERSLAELQRRQLAAAGVDDDVF